MAQSLIIKIFPLQDPGHLYADQLQGGVGGGVRGPPQGGEWGADGRPASGTSCSGGRRLGRATSPLPLLDLCLQVSCDWAYWYLPDSRTVRPARVTLRSRGRVADTGAGAGEVRGGGRGEGAGQHQGRGSGKSISKSVERPVNDIKEIEKEKVDDKPWRKFMKKPSVDLPATDDTVEVVKEPEKPWRVNMKAKARKEEEKSSDAALPRVEKEDRPWRANMKKDSSKGEAVKEPVVKKRHYDRKEVKEFMKAKRAKEKEEKEEKERQEELRKTRIAGRLRELELKHSVQKERGQSQSTLRASS